MFIIYLLVYGVSYWPQTYYASQDDLGPLTLNPNPLSLSQCCGHRCALPCMV